MSTSPSFSTELVISSCHRHLISEEVDIKINGQVDQVQFKILHSGIFVKILNHVPQKYIEFCDPVVKSSSLQLSSPTEASQLVLTVDLSERISVTISSLIVVLLSKIINRPRVTENQSSPVIELGDDRVIDQLYYTHLHKAKELVVLYFYSGSRTLKDSIRRWKWGSCEGYDTETDSFAAINTPRVVLFRLGDRFVLGKFDEEGYLQYETCNKSRFRQMIRDLDDLDRYEGISSYEKEKLSAIRRN